ncbi:MAG: hypothetical protein HHJ17_08625 [Rhodoferax sp.]|uniref:hypothetical protein n=1 Tax=Rhodoferax sp. TaxID=50421 RepID=UPI0017C09B9B|nr:hypothetical protein [Rhodoferax sp.]NMM13585.1 hypothetical protein [Rhodoferax sp.]
MNPGNQQKDAEQPIDEQIVAQMGLSMGLTNGLVVKAFTHQLGHLDKRFSINALSEELQAITDQVKDGDLHHLEAMLVTQAIALQSIFTDLATRASAQTKAERADSLLLLALKAQSHSRATISTLADLKFPRQTTFVKQANVSHGPQQVVNGARAPAGPVALQNKPSPVLELSHDGSDALPVAIASDKGMSRARARKSKPYPAKQTDSSGG